MSGQRSIQPGGGGGGQVKGQSSWGEGVCGVSGSKVNPATGVCVCVRVKGQSSRGGGEVVVSKVNPAGGVRSKVNQAGGVRSKVNPAGGRGGQVQLGGGSGPAGGGVSILRPLVGGMPLAFTQEDFLVLKENYVDESRIY